MTWLFVGVVAAVIMAGVACWFAFRFVGQFGGMLLRLDRVEDRIAKGGLAACEMDSTTELPHVVRSPVGALYMRDSDEAKPSLLYICPIIPSTTGSGLAMRAGTVLQILARQYRVWLLATPLSEHVHPLTTPFAELCEEWAIVPLEPFEREAMIQPWEPLTRPPGRGTAVYWNMAFDVVHVFRLYSLPVARFYLPAGALRQLDLDDVESKSHSRHAALRHRLGDIENATIEEEQAERFRNLEDQTFDLFDRVFVCSELDRRELSERTSIPVVVLPNAVDIPPLLPLKPHTGPFRFLFIGSLEYFPNQEAVSFFATEVMPLIWRQTSSEIVFTVAGSGAESIEDTVAHLPGVEFVGRVSDVAHYYETSDAVVVPISSGGGTRIKILEAFSYRRPVVSTPVGVEGIDARDGEEILLGETAEAFASQCMRLMEDRVLSLRLTENALMLVRRDHTVDAVFRKLDATPAMATMPVLSAESTVTATPV